MLRVDAAVAEDEEARALVDRALGRGAERVERRLERRARRPSAVASNSAGSTASGKSGSGSATSFASSSFVRIGCASSSRRHCCGVSASRLPSPPRQLTSVITSFSRIGSIGGFVTCANCCLK